MIGGMSEAVLRRRELSKGTKLKVVNATMMPSLLYGCEAWILTRQQKLKVQASMNVLRTIQRVSRMERIRSEDIRQHLGQGSVLDVIGRRQENWKGRLNEWNSNRVTKKVCVGGMEGRRSRGRLRMRWSNNFK